MSEEDVGLTGSEESSVETEVEGGEQPQGGDVKQEAVDPKFAGKSAADLVDIIRNQEKQIGKQANEVGQVRQLSQELAYLRDFVQSNLAQPRQEQQRPPQAATPDFITDPDGWLQANLKRATAEMDKRYGQVLAQRDAQEAMTNASIGKEAFFNGKNKDLYDGIETEVEANVSNGFRRGLISKAELINPKTWEAAAIAVHWQKGDLDKLYGRKGMPAPQVERPGRANERDEDLVELTDEDRQEARENNWTEKQAREYKKIAVDSARRGTSQFSGGF
jgi:hypothetical protein